MNQIFVILVVVLYVAARTFFETTEDPKANELLWASAITILMTLKLNDIYGKRRWSLNNQLLYIIALSGIAIIIAAISTFITRIVLAF